MCGSHKNKSLRGWQTKQWISSGLAYRQVVESVGILILETIPSQSRTTRPPYVVFLIPACGDPIISTSFHQGYLELGILVKCGVDWVSGIAKNRLAYQQELVTSLSHARLSYGWPFWKERRCEIVGCALCTRIHHSVSGSMSPTIEWTQCLRWRSM